WWVVIESISTIELGSSVDWQQPDTGNRLTTVRNNNPVSDSQIVGRQRPNPHLDRHISCYPPR
ncbi:MAG TPA: hypothetical protein VEB67_03530, partial [Nitrososphaerales archaeon]|nr:hypothetical protein [Nitrososphaerales archaeon]